ncbi:MAG TPA: ABC transporter ATP-binding protein [Alphaproteobacteria bacterium]
MSDALALEGVERTFVQGAARLRVLAGASFSVQAGEVVALVGPSGAGKSTLLHIAGLLERPDAGEVKILGTPCARLGDQARTELRRKTLGFVYQFHHLLPEFTALENVVIPQMIAGVAKRAATKRARDLLGLVGLAERERHRPARLSGGEQQRVAMARALANAPKVLLADEPTGNLDQTTAGQVFDMLMNVVRGQGVAALIATHNLDLAARMDRALRLADGKVVPA